MSAHDLLPRTQFGTVLFPARRIRLGVAGRAFEHEYPHVPKTKWEKLGARSKKVQITASFHDRFRDYPGLYPDGMLQMLEFAETQETHTLIHRSAGSWPAFILNYNQDLDAKIRSGEEVEIEFVEDSSDFDINTISLPNAQTSLAITAQQLRQDLANTISQLSVTRSDMSIFDALDAAVSTVVAFQDTATLLGNRYAAELQHVTDLCLQIHDTMQSMQDVRAWPVVNSVMILWGQAIQCGKDIAQQGVQLQRYTVPAPMTSVELSMRLYKGDASRQSDLLALNADVIPNPILIKAGTSIRYYPST